eukprot:3273410-Rhodomonas_salina.2
MPHTPHLLHACASLNPEAQAWDALPRSDCVLDLCGGSISVAEPDAVLSGVQVDQPRLQMISSNRRQRQEPLRTNPAREQMQ